MEHWLQRLEQSFYPLTLASSINQLMLIKYNQLTFTYLIFFCPHVSLNIPTYSLSPLSTVCKYLIISYHISSSTYTFFLINAHSAFRGEHNKIFLYLLPSFSCIQLIKPRPSMPEKQKWIQHAHPCTHTLTHSKG